MTKREELKRRIKELKRNIETLQNDIEMNFNLDDDIREMMWPEEMKIKLHQEILKEYCGYSYFRNIEMINDCDIELEDIEKGLREKEVEFNIKIKLIQDIENTKRFILKIFFNDYSEFERFKKQHLQQQPIIE